MVRPFIEVNVVLLTKLDMTKILVNLPSIKYLEEVPDTLIFFLNGDRLMVRESLSEVLNAVKAYNRSMEAPATP